MFINPQAAQQLVLCFLGLFQCEFLESVGGEPIASLKCGYGCSEASTVDSSHKSLLGPEFIEYEEPPPFSSHEFAAIARDLNNIAWIRSSLQSASTQLQGASMGATSQMGILKQQTTITPDAKGNFELSNMLMSSMADVMSSQMPGPSFAFPDEVAS